MKLSELIALYKQAFPNSSPEDIEITIYSENGKVDILSVYDSTPNEITIDIEA